MAGLALDRLDVWEKKQKEPEACRNAPPQERNLSICTGFPRLSRWPGSLPWWPAVAPPLPRFVREEAGAAVEYPGLPAHRHPRLRVLLAMLRRESEPRLLRLTWICMSAALTT